ncbi:hypothetical protein SUDANB95_04896 [Actinosynnema sp. ALI-1.44]
MITCGLKLTHDGAVALLDDGRLVFSVEVEKLDNNLRYSSVPDMAVVTRVLADFGCRPSDVDEWVIDGWDGSARGSVALSDHGTPLRLDLAAYREPHRTADLLRAPVTGEFSLGGATHPYTSYLHVAGHVASAYCTSPFAESGEPSFVLTWDGGMFPRLYHVEPDVGVRNLGSLFPLVGHSYATAAHHFGPFRRIDEAKTVDDLSVAGKLMAYIALGSPHPVVLDVLSTTFAEHFESEMPGARAYRDRIGGWGSNAEPSLSYVHAFFRDVSGRLKGSGISDEDVLASVHMFLGQLLVARATDRVRELTGPDGANLCFVGGCALNIKWNSELRAAPVFDRVWVPPFPNDSGSALGTAAAHLWATRGIPALRWHVRSGPALGPAPATLPDGWVVEPCSPAELAQVLHHTGAPVVLLDGRAELGPRALGGRSIIAPATDAAMKDMLNDVKKREPYRPVAPICLVDHATEVFDPGTPDPYMLFDHRVRDDWTGKIPAVLHLDGTARLQTVSAADDPVLGAVLTEYYRLSGVPVLCNTSANHNGSGFFPDVESALAWGLVPAVWSDGLLYRRSA